MNIPQLTGLFEPQPYVEPKDATENNIANLAAMQDPSGALAKIQSDQILKSMTGLKLDGITERNKQLALNAIKEYTDKAKSLYAGKKGFARLQLGADEQLQEDNHFKNLLTDINTMKESEADYVKTMEKAHEDFKAGIITGTDYAAFSKDIDEKFKTAKKIADIPLTHAVYNNYLTNKKVPNEFLKEFDEAMKVPGQKGALKTHVAKDPVTGKMMNVLDYDPWNDALPVIQLNPRIQAGLVQLFGGDEAKIQQFVRDRYGASGNTMAPQGTVNNFNGWGVSHPKDYPMTMDGTKRIWEIPDKPLPYKKDGIPGSLTAIGYENGKFFGEFSVDHMKVDSAAFNSWNIKQPRAYKDRTQNDVYPVELSATDYGNAQRAGINPMGADKLGWNEMINQTERKDKNRPGTAAPGAPKAPVEAQPKARGRDIYYDVVKDGKQVKVTKQTVYDGLKKANPGMVITDELIYAALQQFGYKGSHQVQKIK